MNSQPPEHRHSAAGRLDAGGCSALPAVGWQFDALDRLREWAAVRPDVLEVKPSGSAASGGEELDVLSDLDVTITAHAPYSCAEQFERMVAACFGRVFARAQSGREDGITLRLVLTDLRRIDATIVAPPRGSAQAFAPPSRAPAHGELDLLINDFLFEAVLAAVKGGRGDLLIAAHLTLGLARHVLVAAMLLRDRETGTRHHRHGGTGHDRWAAQLGPTPAFTHATAVTAAIRHYTTVLAVVAAAYGIAQPVDAAPLLTLLDAIDALTS